MFGANFDEGRGNISMGVEVYNREPVLEVDREAFTDRYSDPNAAGYFGFLQGTSHYNCLFNCPSPANVNGVFADRPAGTNVFSPISGNFFRQFNFNADGTSVWNEDSAAGLSSTPVPRPVGLFTP